MNESGFVMVLVGVLLGIAGAWSIRTVLLAAGFGAGWIIASALGAPLIINLVIAAVAALAAYLVLRLASTVVFFVLGALVGAVVGARLYRLLEGGDGSLLLAIIFIPAVGVAGGWLAEKARERFVAWGTSIAGAALTLSGLGVVFSWLGWLRDPDPGQPVQGVLGAAIWVALAVGYRLAQRQIARDDAPAGAQ